ncbi:MAG: alpha/beta hydrolase, partial [Clostridia bacterium]|nr:alpha/beta hydrolase [Clostridia bacterium]
LREALMNSFISIFLTFTALLSGLYSQVDYVVEPEKYNGRTLEVAELPEPVSLPETDAYIQLGEVNMHYLVFGKGKPELILVHGNGGSADSLREAATYLANEYTVYVPESRCHGKSSDPGEISYHLMAKDLKEFIEAMGLEKPVVMGHSDGGINAITLAADYPDVPGAIISCGANSHPKTFKLYFPLGVAIKNLFKHDKLNDLMLTEPDFTPEYLAQIRCPAYIVSGQSDIMWINDTVFIAENIPDADMTVLKGETHSSYMSKDGKKAYTLAHEWLNEKQL